MPSGKANIQSANPPSKPEPNAPAIVAKLHKPQKEAKEKPRQQKHKRGFQEDGLGLRELLNGVKGEDGLREEAEDVGADAGVGGYGGIRCKEDAGVGGLIQQIPNCACAVAPIVPDAV